MVIILYENYSFWNVSTHQSVSTRAKISYNAGILHVTTVTITYYYIVNVKIAVKIFLLYLWAPLHCEMPIMVY